VTWTITAGTAAVLTATLALSAAGWVVAVHQMQGMNMGAGTQLGSLQFFIAVWVTMMAAMMLPGAVPALLHRARAGKPVIAVPMFAVSYLAVWTLVGLVVYALYHPHTVAVAGALTVTAGLYELTPLKRTSRRRCRENVRSGSRFGCYCADSSIGLMLVLLAISAMSVPWMCAIAAIVTTQKLVPPRALLDIPLALALTGLGIVLVIAPSLVPGLTPPTM
jgi:predicted metal-binding membrane protein